MENQTIRAKVYPADGGDVTEVQLLPNSLLRQLQQLVGGYIETVRVTGSPELTLVVNEEGLLLGLPQNCYAELIGVPPFVGRGVLIETKHLYG